MMMRLRYIALGSAAAMALAAPGLALAQAGPVSSAGGDGPDAVLPPGAASKAPPAPVQTLSDPDDAPVAQTAGGPKVSAQSARHFDKSINFRKLVVAMAPGQSWGVVHTGRFCLGTTALAWTGGAGDMKSPQFIAQFVSKVEARNLGSTRLTAAPGVYNLYGLVTKISGDFCLPRPRDKDAVKGKLTLAIEWRFYAPSSPKPAAILTTSSDYKQKDLTSGGVEGMLDDAFGENLTQLLDAPEVRQALATPLEG
ncbi:MAG: hypothetical protein ACYDD1_23500 [Caulobacteraceae bacterium]